MGRRKIEIKAIKDDRNRSVTFLKRKAGLFKKAHELSVLCSVDVAVIVFGQNKKLYEYSSGDINQTLSRYQYYGAPHEHKGPSDFVDRGGQDDDDEDEDNVASDQPDNASPPHHGVVPNPVQNQPGFQHMRQATPSQSPPVQNGMFHPRMGTPQPQSGSRPSSRNTHVRRQSSNLVPQDHPHPQAAQPMMPNMNYQYQPNNSYYPNHQAATANMQGHQQQGTPPMPQHHHFTHPPPQHQMNQYYLQREQQRQSLPPNLPANNPQQERSRSVASMGTPPQPSRPFQSPPLPGHGTMQHQNRPQGNFATHDPQRQAMRPPPQWDAAAAAEWAQRNQPPIKQEGGPRSQSFDTGAGMRDQQENGTSHSRYGPPSAPSPKPAQRVVSNPSAPTPPSRVNSMQSDAKRPRLTVQIPGEASDGGSATADSSPKEPSRASITPAKPGTTESSHSSGIVLPAPSPRSASAGPVLSAGATGPTNPFARPNLPNRQNSNMDSFRDNIASPMSALPSRVMGESGYMSSPSSMFPELGFGSVGGNNLASPAVYQPTPIQMHGPSFRDPPTEKRKSIEDTERESSKKIKSEAI